MKAIQVPDAGAHVTTRIDYVAKRLGQLLKPHQFTRKRRIFRRQLLAGKKVDVVQVFDLQGSRHNEGHSGTFCINLGVYFAQLKGTLKRFDPFTTLADMRPAASHFYLRIDKILPKKRQPWWPRELNSGQDSWFKVGPKVDLIALGDSLCRVVETYLLPWYADRASLEAVALGLPPTNHVQRAVALALLGRKDEARQHATARKLNEPDLEAWLKRQ